ncbi:MAG: hypothetical protein E7458_06365 [Ruminococcaceae bacterium]|nr:hypothetical protein [Oscillospiraceae bacterium]
MKTLCNKLLPLALVILTGAAGGALRGYELTAYYNDATGLYDAGPVTYALLGFSAVMVLFCVCFAFVKKGAHLSYGQLYRCGTAGTMLTLLSGVILLAAGIFRAYTFLFSRSMASLLFGVLTILCGVTLCALSIARKNRTMPELTGLGAVALIYWAAFMLVQVFMEHPVEPEEFVYVYDLLGMCFALLAVYAATAQIFGKERTRLSLLSALAAIFLLIVSAFGRVMTFAFSGSLYYIFQSAFRILVSAALVCYLTANAASVLLHWGEVSDEPEEPEPAEETPADGEEEDREAV